MDSKNKVILMSVIAGVLVIGLVVGANVSGKAVATPEEVSTDFAIDAWGYAGWGDCSSQYGTRAQLDAFCISKGYDRLASGNACKHTPVSNRWQWDGKVPMVQGKSTGNSDALTKVKCVSSATYSTCTDTDASQDYTLLEYSDISTGGPDMYIKGETAWASYGTSIDTCVIISENRFVSSCDATDSRRCGVQEHFCFPPSSRGAHYILCPNGCRYGACMAASDPASSPKQNVLDMFEGRCDVGYVDEEYTWLDLNNDEKLTGKEVCNNGQHTKTGHGSACVMAFLQEESNSPLRPSDCEEQHVLGDFDKLWTTCCTP